MTIQVFFYFIIYFLGGWLNIHDGGENSWGESIIIV